MYQGEDNRGENQSWVIIHRKTIVILETLVKFLKSEYSMC